MDLENNIIIRTVGKLLNPLKQNEYHKQIQNLYYNIMFIT